MFDLNNLSHLSFIDSAATIYHENNSNKSRTYYIDNRLTTLSFHSRKDKMHHVARDKHMVHMFVYLIDLAMCLSVILKVKTSASCIIIKQWYGEIIFLSQGQNTH